MQPGEGPRFARDPQARLKAILDALGEAVTIRNRDHQIVYANTAAIERMGFASLEELQSRPPRSIMGDYVVTDEDGAELTMDDVPSVRLLRGESGEPLLMRTVERASGKVRWNLLKSAPLYDSQGEIEAVVTIIEDVTAAKTAEQRFRFLAQASEILASELDYQRTLRNVALLAVPEIADWCAVDLINERGEREQVVAAHPDPRKLELAERLREFEPEVLDAGQPLGRIIRTGLAELYPDITDEMLEAGAQGPEHLALLHELQMRAALIVPIKSPTRTLGVMTLVSAESGRSFDEGDVELAEQLAARAAVAVENARLYTARADAAATLRQTLLPQALPAVPGWEIAGLYRPAGHGLEAEVGGDFYDVFEAEGGYVVCIGDVTGKGVQAAAMTLLVRHGVRFISEYEPQPYVVLERLDTVLRGERTLSLCTALCLYLDFNRATISSAGHPLPLLVGADGKVREVGRSGPVLGAFTGSQWPEESVELAPGETLVLYTDGVTDTIGSAGRFGERRLREVLSASCALAPAEMLDALDRALSRFQVGKQADDTAALALRRV